MDTKQVELTVCPQCNDKLNYDKTTNELVCNSCGVAYPIEDGIPVMLIEQARKLEKQDA